MKVAGFRVEESIALSKVALTEASIPTPTAPFAGFVEVTVGAVVSVVVPVVKVHTKLPANALPDRSLAPVVTVAV